MPTPMCISMTYLRLRKNVEKPNTATNDNAVVFGNADAKTLPSYFCMHMQILRNRHTIAISYFSTYKLCMLGISEYRNSSAEQLLSIVWLSFVPNSCAYTLSYQHKTFELQSAKISTMWEIYDASHRRRWRRQNNNNSRILWWNDEYNFRSWFE